ncbi:MAG: U32 family peptidase [Clostridia bacterium]|nr:U32 family peptidase [Clostridia bacterium]
MSRLKTAVHFGADAVYFGVKGLSLRAFAGNFDRDEAEEALRYLHERGKKGYAALNIYPREEDFPSVIETLGFLQEIGVDAVIVSDPGVIRMCRQFPGLKIHLSTQANTLNSEAALFWRDMGVERIVAGRELSLNELTAIKSAMGDTCGLEVFAHGAMCVSYSGRCLLSNYLTGRDSNRGACAQPCRWEYTVTETQSGKSLLCEEDARGTYLFNSRDLCTVEILPALVATGVDSLKIEGRMKTEFYVATVVGAYRKALDSLQNGVYNPAPYLAELEKASHRPYNASFLLHDRSSSECTESAQNTQKSEFIAAILGYDEARGALLLEQRNRFYVGDTLELLAPGERFNQSFTVEEMWDEEGNPVTDAKLVRQRLYVKCPFRGEPLEMLRRVKV